MNKAILETAVDAVFIVCLTVLMALDQIQPDTGIPLMVLTVGIKAGLVARRPSSTTKAGPSIPPPTGSTGGLVAMVFGLAAALANAIGSSGIQR